MLRFIKKLPFYRRYTTNQFRDWWKNRKIDWKKEYLDTADHPHRHLITWYLSKMNWKSLIEIGCGPGANLVNIVRKIPGRQVGGVDINPEAIVLARQTFQGGHFRVGSADDMLLSDGSTDVVLSDMTLIYVGPLKVDRYIREINRITRNFVIFCEFHSKSWWNRLALLLNSGHHAYNWKKLLEKHGFCDIMIERIPEKYWPDADKAQKLFAHIIIARKIK